MEKWNQTRILKDGLMRRILIRKTNQWESNIWQTWKKEKKNYGSNFALKTMKWDVGIRFWEVARRQRQGTTLIVMRMMIRK